jgi:predicted enzyme related to lactoylglutathione lyase
MGRPVVHFEIIGPEPQRLRRYYSDLFDWQAQDAPVAPEVSEPDSYGFIEPTDAPAGTGIPGGIGGGAGFEGCALFYVGVEDVEQALHEAERLGGTRVMGPAMNPDGSVMVGHFRDPAGNLIGVAAPA